MAAGLLPSKDRCYLGSKVQCKGRTAFGALCLGQTAKGWHVCGCTCLINEEKLILLPSTKPWPMGSLGDHRQRQNTGLDGHLVRSHNARLNKARFGG